MSLTEDCKVMFFSTATVEESKKDDVRFDARYWDVWQIVER
jgi:dTDP-4-dehydrorhamnose 3,5-epimerase